MWLYITVFLFPVDLSGHAKAPRFPLHHFIRQSRLNNNKMSNSSPSAKIKYYITIIATDKYSLVPSPSMVLLSRFPFTSTLSNLGRCTTYQEQVFDLSALSLLGFSRYISVKVSRFQGSGLCHLSCASGSFNHLLERLIGWLFRIRCKC